MQTRLEFTRQVIEALEHLEFQLHGLQCVYRGQQAGTGSEKQREYFAEGIFQLHLLLDFVSDFDDLGDGDRLGPSRRVVAELYDLLQNRKTSGIDCWRQNTGGRKKASHFQLVLHRFALWATQELYSTGVKIEEACALVVREFNGAGVRDINGKRLTARQIRNWRDKATGTSKHEELGLRFREIKDEIASRTQLVSSDEAKARVKLIAKTLATFFSQSGLIVGIGEEPT